MKRALLAALALLAVAALGAAVLLLPSLRARARVGAGYAAKQVCSCMFVAGRDLVACRADLPAEMDPIRVAASSDGVRAWIPLLGERHARYAPERGCALDLD